MLRVGLATLSVACAVMACSCATGNDEVVATNYGPGADSGGVDATQHDDTGATGDATGDTDWPIPDSGVCSANTCAGCCLPNGACADGLLDDQCGKGGWPCTSCSSQGSHCSSGVCKACTPSCATVACGQGDGCGGTCASGSGCCTPVCSGVVCGKSDGCGGTCASGSGCCSPSCGGVLCGLGDSCGGTCQTGSGCCSPDCSGATCGESDGCGGTCDGSCPQWERCSSSHSCECSPSPNYKVVGGVCRPSCGILLGKLNLPNNNGGCCAGGCQSGTFAGGPGDTWDCTYCCSSSIPGQSTCN